VFTAGVLVVVITVGGDVMGALVVVSGALVVVTGGAVVVTGGAVVGGSVGAS